jgi:hypothetical protein
MTRGLQLVALALGAILAGVTIINAVGYLLALRLHDVFAPYERHLLEGLVAAVIFALSAAALYGGLRKRVGTIVLGATVAFAGATFMLGNTPAPWRTELQQKTRRFLPLGDGRSAVALRRGEAVQVTGPGQARFFARDPHGAYTTALGSQALPARFTADESGWYALSADAPATTTFAIVPRGHR